MFHSALTRGAPTPPCTARPSGAQRVTFALVPRRAPAPPLDRPGYLMWFSGVPANANCIHQSAAPGGPCHSRHSVGRFRFTFLVLTLCMYLSRADTYPTRRARSPAAPARRGATRLTIIYRHTTRAPARHPPPPVPRSSSLFISHMLSQRETRAHTWTVPGCPSSARTGATTPAAPVVNHHAPPCRGRPILALCRCACYVCPHTSHSTALHSAPFSPSAARPQGLRSPFSPSFLDALPRRPWIAQDI